MSCYEEDLKDCEGLVSSIFLAPLSPKRPQGKGRGIYLKSQLVRKLKGIPPSTLPARSP
jgi:hypothetical protein